MGSRIAAHFANAGLPCILLDIVPPDCRANAPAGERNKIVRAGLDAAKKSKPAAFFPPRSRNELPSEISTTIWRVVRKRIGSSKSSRKIWRSREIARPGGTVSQAWRHRNHQHFRFARALDRRRHERRVSAALGRHPFFQSAALFEVGGSHSRAEDLEGRRRFVKRVLRSPPGQRRGGRQGHAEFHCQPHRNVFHAQCVAPNGRAGDDRGRSRRLHGTSGGLAKVRDLPHRRYRWPRCAGARCEKYLRNGPQR